MNAHRTLVAVSLLLLAALGCEGDPTLATQTLVVIDGEDGVRKAAETLFVKAGPLDGEPTYDERFTRADEDLVWPRVLALAPAGGDASRRFEVSARALDVNNELVARARAVSGYVEGKRLMLTLLLEDECLGIDCGAHQTCRAGDCEEPDVDPLTLKNSDPSMIADPIVVVPDGPPADRDGGGDGGDGDVDAGRDAGVAVDAGRDAGGSVDAGTDAGAAVDAGTDAGAAVDAGTDAGGAVDSGTDAGGGVDAGTDAGGGVDAGTDAGCNAALDSDSDGVDDCADGCPADPGSTAPTDCGCPSSPADVGTPCADDPCGIARQCDGDAACGDLTMCRPTGSCTFASYEGMDSVGYWFCTNVVEWGDARDRCRDAGPGWELVRIDDAVENEFVRVNRVGVMWIGASDRDTEGQWRWLRGDEQFWQGQSGGSPVGSLYANWDSGNPSGDGIGGLMPKDVARIQATGLWNDVNGVTNSQPFVCEGPADECPNSYKVLAGVCGCDMDDVDTDGDGVLDCIDGCPDDADFTAVGRCGCPSTPTASGTGCTDYCGNADTCDTAAFCGDPMACAPVGGTCTYDTYVNAAGHGYWFCTDTQTWGDSQIACESIGGHLARINDAEENEFVRMNIQASAYLGGSDLGSEGRWYWIDGAVFFQGSALLYTNWNAGQPDGAGSANRLVMDATTGGWNDLDGTLLRTYVCELP